ncbi:hypothetical protein Cha6605_5200 [Chamaesiphon minutus PCC 6605]|uniref:Uncharacterized protein n=1 Tax=Chamaesiphon minutus (strain ATCC 27169 / PCC 6605) TaxID=1173020 RepID=K9UNR9_CHAP6|nr:hypothetical protein Cha6605_5200 [Chamaesiphon minutus PCC 6605]
MSRRLEATALMLRQVFPDREKLLQSPTSSTTSGVSFPDRVGAISGVKRCRQILNTHLVDILANRSRQTAIASAALMQE